MAKVSKVKSNKTLTVCVLLILASLVLDNIAQLTSVFEDLTGNAKKYNNWKTKKKTEFVINIIVTVIYVVVLVLCLVSLFKK